MPPTYFPISFTIKFQEYENKAEIIRKKKRKSGGI
jgi:hypothetical protein